MVKGGLQAGVRVISLISDMGFSTRYQILPAIGGHSNMDYGHHRSIYLILGYASNYVLLSGADCAPPSKVGLNEDGTDAHLLCI